MDDIMNPRMFDGETITDEYLLPEKVYRAQIGKDLDGVEWKAFAYRISGAIRYAIEQTIIDCFDDVDEMVVEYLMELDQEWEADGRY